MFRKPVLAALGLALMSSAALAQPADDRAPNAPPAQLNGPGDGNNNSNTYNDADRDAPPPPSQQQAQAARSRDLFCRRDAAARTGYVTPGQAASHEQTNGSVGGTVLGAAAGAAIGGASGHAGAGALIGAGAGLIAGTAIGQDNARHAASDVERAYADAYYACMDEADNGPQSQYAEGPPPPPYGYDYYDYYGPPPAYYYPGYYPYPYYYGPRVSFGFGFGGYHGGFGGYRGYGGGFRHR